MVICCFYYPYFTIPCAIILACVFLLDYTMSNGVRETKRLDNEKKAPVIHHITSSMAGIVTIRGFQREKIFLQRLVETNSRGVQNLDLSSFRFSNYLNTSTSADSLFRLATRWFMWRIETLSFFAIAATCIVCVALKVTNKQIRH